MTMAETEQVKPLAPFSYRARSDEDEAISRELKSPKRNYIKCCGCVGAVFLLLAVTLLVLGFTVLHVKDPEIRLISLTFQRALWNTTSLENVNMTLTADVSVKNPNVAAFRYSNGTTEIYYQGAKVGEGEIPPGAAKARHTQRMNVTVQIDGDDVLAFPSLSSDLSTGALVVSSYTKIRGRVKILNIINRKVVVQMNCTMTYNIASNAIVNPECNPHVRV